MARSIVALSKLYELHDPRLARVQVRGDLVVPPSSRIMTRSRARQTPDQYTRVSAPLKIIKVLVEELLSAAGTRTLDAAAAAELEDDDDEGGSGEWEDEPLAFLDLGTGMTKSQLMALGEEDEASSAPRGRDDETQAFLMGFFRAQAHEPTFDEMFQALTAEEREKLVSVSGT